MERQEQIETVNSSLKIISTALGLDLALDHEEICTFQVEEQIIAIEVSQDYPVVHLYSPLLALPTEDKDLTVGLLARALELNSFQMLTRGGSIATAPGGGFLIYCYSVPIEETDAEKFSLILGAFYKTVPELKILVSEAPSAVDVKKETAFQKGFIKI